MAVRNQKAFTRYQNILKTVRRQYPNKDFRWQQQKASELMHQGKEKQLVKVGSKKEMNQGHGHKKAAGASKNKTTQITGKKSRAYSPVIVVQPEKRSAPKKGDALVQRAMKIQGVIDKLEVTRKAQSTRQMRDIVQRAINYNHGKLKEIAKQQRARR